MGGAWSFRLHPGPPHPPHRCSLPGTKRGTGTETGKVNLPEKELSLRGPPLQSGRTGLGARRGRRVWGGKSPPPTTSDWQSLFRQHRVQSPHLEERKSKFLRFRWRVGAEPGERPVRVVRLPSPLGPRKPPPPRAPPRPGSHFPACLLMRSGQSRQPEAKHRGHS